jgi:hypothetical protein
MRRLDAAATIAAGTSNFQAAARRLAQAGNLTCVVTAGAQGAFTVTAAGARQRTPSPIIRPVDTTGAGDTFVGAFAAMLSERASVQEAFRGGMRGCRPEVSESRGTGRHAEQGCDNSDCLTRGRSLPDMEPQDLRSAEIRRADRAYVQGLLGARQPHRLQGAARRSPEATASCC